MHAFLPDIEPPTAHAACSYCSQEYLGNKLDEGVRWKTELKFPAAYQKLHGARLASLDCPKTMRPPPSHKAVRGAADAVAPSRRKRAQAGGEAPAEKRTKTAKKAPTTKRNHGGSDEAAAAAANGGPWPPSEPHDDDGPLLILLLYLDWSADSELPYSGSMTLPGDCWLPHNLYLPLQQQQQRVVAAAPGFALLAQSGPGDLRTGLVPVGARGSDAESSQPIIRPLLGVEGAAPLPALLPAPLRAPLPAPLPGLLPAPLPCGAESWSPQTGGSRVHGGDGLGGLLGEEEDNLAAWISTTGILSAGCQQRESIVPPWEKPWEKADPEEAAAAGAGLDAWEDGDIAWLANLIGI